MVPVAWLRGRDPGVGALLAVAVALAGLAGLALLVVAGAVGPVVVSLGTAPAPSAEVDRRPSAFRSTGTPFGPPGERPLWD